jgi:hypothetical protein
MKSPFGEIIDGLYQETRRTAEDVGAEQTARGRDVYHAEVRAEHPGERGDLMARSDSDSADDEAEDERVVLVPVKPMPQWRPRPPRRAPPRRLTWRMKDWDEAPLAIAEGEREADPGAGAGAEQVDEPDAEHEDLPVGEEPWPGLLEERMNVFRDVLQADDPRDARGRLERFLGTMEGHQLRPQDVRPTTLGNSVLSILAQHKACRICPI